MKRIQAETGVKNSELLAKPDLEDHIVMKMFISMGVEIGKAGHIEVEKTITGPQTQYKVEFYVCTHAELQKIINLVRQIQRRPIPRLINQKADEIYDLITR